MKRLLIFYLVLAFINSNAQSVGIGSSSFAPGSMLSVDGGVSIGNGYRSTAAPSNGLIVEGNVGIGYSTASLVSPLRINVGNAATSGTSYGVLIDGTFSQANTGAEFGIYLSPTYTNTGTLTSAFGIHTQPFNNGSGTITNLYGLNASPLNNSTGTVTSMVGVNSNPSNQSTGTVGNVFGGSFAPNNASTGTISGALWGAQFVPQNLSTANVSTMVGIYSYPQNHSTGTVTTTYGVRIENPYNPSGTITTNHALSIANQTTGANNYAIYSEGGKSYHAGNFGIGTAIPGAMLSLGTSTANTKLALYDDGTNFYGMGIQSNEYRFHVYNAAADFRFYSAPAGSALFTIKGTGNIGIGSSSPGTQLEVAANTAIKLGDLFLSSGGDFAHISNNNWYNGSAWSSNLDNRAGALIQLTTGDTRFWSSSSGTGVPTFTNNMTILSGGNVGIGSATPAAKLDVNGTIAIAGSTGSSGQVLMSNGTSAPSWTTLSASTGGGFTNCTVYSTAGSYTFTTAANVTKIMVEVWGSGGGGNTTTTAFTGGGGGGAYAREIITVTGGTNYYVTVGAGGTAGNAGNSSCFSSAASCAGTSLTCGGGSAGGNRAGGSGGTVSSTWSSNTAFTINGQRGERGTFESEWYDSGAPSCNYSTAGHGGDGGSSGPLCNNGGTGGVGSSFCGSITVATGTAGNCGGGGGNNAAGGAGRVVIWY